jgi:hypothetical protein
MGVRTRGLDIKAGAAKLKADRATRVEAELVVDRWNRRIAGQLNESGTLPPRARRPLGKRKKAPVAF